MSGLATEVGVMEFGPHASATFYDDGTVEIGAVRRLTAGELRKIVVEAERCATMHERRGLDPDRPRYIW